MISDTPQSFPVVFPLQKIFSSVECPFSFTRFDSFLGNQQSASVHPTGKGSSCCRTTPRFGKETDVQSVTRLLSQFRPRLTVSCQCQSLQKNNFILLFLTRPLPWLRPRSSLSAHLNAKIFEHRSLLSLKFQNSLFLYSSHRWLRFILLSLTQKLILIIPKIGIVHEPERNSRHLRCHDGFCLYRPFLLNKTIVISSNSGIF